MKIDKDFSQKSDKELFPYLFEDTEIRYGANLQKFEKELEKQVTVKDFKVSWENYATVSYKGTLKKDLLGDLYVQKEVDKIELHDNYKYKKDLAIWSAKYEIEKKLAKVAEKYIKVPIPRFPTGFYKVDPIYLAAPDDDEDDFARDVVDIGYVSVFNSCGSVCSPRETIESGFRSISGSVCNSFNLRIISSIVLTLLSIILLLNGTSVLGNLPVPNIVNELLQTTMADVSIVFGGILCFVLLVVMCGYDYLNILSHIVDFFNLKKIVTTLLLIVTGGALIVTSIILSGSYFVPHYMTDNYFQPYAFYQFLMSIHADVFVISLLILSSILEICCAINYLNEQMYSRKEFLKDTERYINNFHSHYNNYYKAFRFFALWAKQMGEKIKITEDDFKYAQRYYFDAIKIYDKQKNKPQKERPQKKQLIPDSVLNVTHKIGPALDVVVVLSCVLAVVSVFVLFFYQNKDEIKEDYDYITQQEAKKIKKEQLEELVSFPSNFYDDYFLSGVDANAMENSGNMLGICLYENDKSDEEIQFIYDNKLVSTHILNPGRDSITKLGGGSYYGILDKASNSVILAKDKIIYCEDGNCTEFKDKKWLSKYNSYSKEELYDALSDILFKQKCDEEITFSAEEVAMIAYARNNGTLLRYTGRDGGVFFAEENGSRLTVYKQTTDGSREIVMDVDDYSYNGKGHKYFMAFQYVFYANDNKLMLYDTSLQQGIVYLENDQTINHMNFIIDQNDDLVIYFSDNEKIYIHDMDRNQGIRISNDIDYKNIQGLYTVGEYIVIVDKKAFTSKDTFSYKKIHVTPDIY